MANRTLQFYGQGYGATPPSITVSIDGNQVFSGPVLGSIDETPPAIFVPADYDLIYTAQLPLSANVTTHNFQLTVGAGAGIGIYSGLVEANYMPTGNAQNPSTGPTGFLSVNPDANSNAAIDGQIVVLPDPRPPGQEGAWTYWIPVGSTFTSTLTIPGGIE